MPKFSTLTVLLCCSFSILTHAQNWQTTLSNHNLQVTISEGGILAGDAPGIQLLTENGPTSLIFRMGLVMGGIDPGGNIRFTDLSQHAPGGVIDENANLNTYWRIAGGQIQAHREDFADNGIIDNPIPAIYAWPGTGNPFFADYNADSLSLPTTSQELASFWDQDSDGIYNPDNGDFPVLRYSGCDEVAIIPAEMVWTPIQANYTSGKADVGLTTFQLNCEEDGAVPNQTVFFQYRISNRQIEDLTDYYLGYYIDGDLGCHQDDYLGFFPLRHAAYFYNSTPQDTCSIGESAAFGTNPPLIAVDLLSGPSDGTGGDLIPLRAAIPVYNAATGGFPAATTDYNTAFEGYQYLQGKWRDGSPLVDNGIGYGEGQETSFAFTGDPQLGTGWTETGEGNPAGDRRILMSYGPKTLQPGDVDEILLAFTYRYDESQTPLEQIDDLRDQIDLVQSINDGCFSLNFLPFTCTEVLTDIRKSPADTDLQWSLAPNPATTEVTLSFPDAASGTVRIYNALGQLQEQHRIRSHQLRIPAERWSTGLYFIQWEKDGHSSVKKLFVK